MYLCYNIVYCFQFPFFIVIQTKPQRHILGRFPDLPILVASYRDNFQIALSKLHFLKNFNNIRANSKVIFYGKDDQNSFLFLYFWVKICRVRNTNIIKINKTGVIYMYKPNFIENSDYLFN